MNRVILGILCGAETDIALPPLDLAFGCLDILAEVIETNQTTNSYKRQFEPVTAHPTLGNSEKSRCLAHI